MSVLAATRAGPSIEVRGRTLRTTAAFRSYWTLAAERQRIFFRRLRGDRPPWTDDPVLTSNRFTNAYRASDRVSQYLINEVIYGADFDERSTVLRVLLFKIFNKVETWSYIEEAVGAITADTFDAQALIALLDQRMGTGERLYSAAYIMPSPKLGESRKHGNHLRLLEVLLADGSIDRMVEAPSLSDLYSLLVDVHSFGPFLAFQYAIDLNYTELFGFSEMDFVVAGPGALDGIAKCFVDTCGAPPEDVIRAVADGAEDCLEDAEVNFESLWGRPLQLIDCQNLFCEVSKYARVVHPELVGSNGRTQIKQRYTPNPVPLQVGYPRGWGLPYGPLRRGQRLEGDTSTVEVSHDATAVGGAHLAPGGKACEDRLFDLP